MAKKLIALFLVAVMVFPLCGCGNSAIKNAQTAISEIGEVTSDSGEAIANAEKLFSILTDSEKSKVKNRLELVEAREAYDAINKKVIYSNAKEAYDKITEVAELCIDGMDDIYGAWYYGIYKASDHSSYQAEYLADEVPDFTSSDIEAAMSALGYSDGNLRYSWEKSVYVIEHCLDVGGVYDALDSLLAESLSILSELTEKYDDYEFYPKLKEYYAKVSSYAEFFKSPTGSFDQLADTINDYENNIRTYQTDCGFLFS